VAERGCSGNVKVIANQHRAPKKGPAASAIPFGMTIFLVGMSDSSPCELSRLAI
jgi:hypothetical protein